MSKQKPFPKLSSSAAMNMVADITTGATLVVLADSGKGYKTEETQKAVTTISAAYKPVTVQTVFVLFVQKDSDLSLTVDEKVKEVTTNQYTLASLKKSINKVPSLKYTKLKAYTTTCKDMDAMVSYVAKHEETSIQILALGQSVAAVYAYYLDIDPSKFKSYYEEVERLASLIQPRFELIDNMQFNSLVKSIIIDIIKNIVAINLLISQGGLPCTGMLKIPSSAEKDKLKKLALIKLARQN